MTIDVCLRHFFVMYIKYLGRILMDYILFSEQKPRKASFGGLFYIRLKMSLGVRQSKGRVGGGFFFLFNFFLLDPRRIKERRNLTKVRSFEA